MDASNLDWKSTIQTDRRVKQVKRILDVLKTCFPSCASVNLGELTKMAEWFEQDIFNAAPSYEAYWHQVLVNNIVMENKLLPNASDDTQSQVHNQGHPQISLPNETQARQHQNVQNTAMSDGDQSSTSLPPALPSMTYLTQSSLPNVAGLSLNIQSGNAQNFVVSSDSQGFLPVMQSHIPQQSQQQPQNLLPPTQMSNADVQRQMINMQSRIAQIFVGSSDSQGLPSVMQSHIPQQSQQQPQNLLQPTPMWNADVQRQRINMQSSNAQNFVGSTVNQGSPSVMQSHNPQQSQQQLQNLLQPIQMSNAVGRSTNTQSEIAQNSISCAVQGVPSNIISDAHAQYLLQQHNPQQHNPSSSMNSNAQTGQNAVDLEEAVYQMIQTMKNKYLPNLNVIYEKISNEYQQSPQGEVQALLESLEIQIQFLNLARNVIFPTWMELMPLFEKHIISTINSANLAQNPVSAQQQIQQPGGHPLSTQPQQQQEEADNQQQQQQQQQQEEEEEVDNQPDASQE